LDGESHPHKTDGGHPHLEPADNIPNRRRVHVSKTPSIYRLYWVFDMESAEAFLNLCDFGSIRFVTVRA